MALGQKSAAWKANYVPQPVDGDFYKIADILNPAEKETLRRVRAFMETEVAPIIEDCWAKAKFPFEIIPKLLALGIAGVGYEGYGCAGGPRC